MKLSCGCEVITAMVKGEQTTVVIPCKPNCIVLQYLMDEAKNLGHRVERRKS